MTKPLINGSRVFINDDNIDRALRKFKKKVQDSGILQELRDREFYEKPSVTRKKNKSSARNRWLKKLRSGQLPAKNY